jgi:hypothetical protein
LLSGPAGSRPPGISQAIGLILQGLVSHEVQEAVDVRVGARR